MKLNLYGVPKQLDFLKSDARYKSFDGGRRVGKSYVFMNEAVKCSLEKSGHGMLYLTHSNSLAKEMFEKLAYHPALRPLIPKNGRRRKEPFKITFKNSSYVDFRNWSNIDKLRGFKWNYAWIDEKQSFPERYMSVVEACIKDTRGRMTVSGQFNGFDWAYYRFYLQGQLPYMINFEGTPQKDEKGELIPNKLYKSWHMETSEGLMFQGALGIEELRQTKLTTPPNVYDQEYRCLPTASLSAVFGYDDVQSCVAEFTPLTKVREKYSYVMSIDTAKVIDHSVVMILEVETGIIVYCRIFPRNMPYATQAMECGKVATDFLDPTCIIDTTGTAGAAGGKVKNPILPIFQSRIKNVRPFTWNMQSKNHLVTHLGIELRNQSIIIPEAYKEITRQLTQYEYKYRGSGFHTFSAPKGDHDDCVSTLCQAVWARHMNWYNKRGYTGYVISGT